MSSVWVASFALSNESLVRSKSAVQISKLVENAVRRESPPNMGLQLTTDSWAFVNSVAFWRRDFCGVALTVSAVCCS